MRELLVATRNKKKLQEIEDLLKGLDFKITSLLDYPNLPKIVEDGETFSSNARKKALSIAMHAKKLTIGEDSGLEVKALKGDPGIYSARFSGNGATDKKNNAKLLRKLKSVPLKERQARYRCFVALADQKGIIDIVDGSCSGSIALTPKGSNGFGYDPLFFISRLNKTFAELPPAVKAKMSHRSRALKKLKIVIRKYFEDSLL